MFWWRSRRANLVIFIILLSETLLLLASEVRTEPVELPPLWPSSSLDKSYHLVYQLQSNKSSVPVTIEEWASIQKQLFRFDVILNEDRARQSYLFNKKTNEIFQYKPFVCNQLNSNSPDLKIFSDLFAVNSDIGYGLVSLWSYAHDKAARVNLTDPNSEENLNYEFLIPFKLYIVSFDDSFSQTQQSPFGLIFYFGPDNQLIEAIDWIDNAPSMLRDVVTHLRARITRIDLDQVSSSVFELPSGYGCRRTPQLDKSMADTNIGLQLLHTGGLNQVVLEITASSPKDSLLQFWDSHAQTLRMMRGSLGSQESSLVSYYVIQDKRTRNVWSATDGSEEATVYSIDNETDECKIGHRNFMHHVKFSLPPGQVRQVSKLALSTDMITFLFSDTTNFHIIKEGTYERRENYFRIENENSADWVGPASIVKQIKSFTETSSEYLEIDGKETKPTLLKDYRITLTIFLYSDDLKQLLYKIALDLIDNEEVDLAYMHKQIDLSACFTKKEDLVVNYPLETPAISRALFAIQDVVKTRFLMNLFVTSPINPLQVTGIEITFDDFFMYVSMGLFDLPLTHTFKMTRNKRLVITDVSALVEQLAQNEDKCAAACDFYHCFRFSFNPIEMRCRLELKKDGLRTEESRGDYLFSSPESKPNSPLIDYTYGEDNGRTHLKPRSIFDLLSKFAPYGEQTNEDDEGNRAFKSHSNYQEVPLQLRIESTDVPGLRLGAGSDEWFLLRPSAVQSDLDSMNAFLREETIVDAEMKSNSSIVTARAEDWSNLRTQYNLFIEGKEFRVDIGSQLIDDIGYDDCASACEDSDCRSFSYCANDQICHLTNLHKMNEIQQASSYDPRCSIYALDYLSKFEYFDRISAPAIARNELKDISAHDCAVACMEEKTFSCKGFYHCKLSTAQTICMLVDKAVSPDDFSAENRSRSYKLSSKSGDMNNQAGANKFCSYYTRSYLVHFDEYYQKTLEFSKDLVDSGAVESIAGLGAESCAQKCIAESCLAFNVCFNSNSSKGMDHVCQLAKQEVRKSHLVSQKRCTTFILSDRSQFNTEKIALIKGEPNRPAGDEGSIASGKNECVLIVVDTEQKRAQDNDINAGILNLFSESNTQNQFDSNWVAKLASLLLGILLGFGGASIWRDKKILWFSC